MLKILLIALMIYGLACLFLYIKQRDMLFFPTAESHAAAASPLWLESQQQRLKIWQFNEGKPALLYFGGNAEAVERNIIHFRHIFKTYTVYLMNYRGYGGSSGSPSEKTLFEDALAVYDFIAKQHPSISAVGRSLGSGIACYLATEREIDKLVLITPYDSVTNLAQSHYPFFPVKWLLKDPFDSLDRAASISNRTLVLMAEYDQIVPLSRSRNLINAFIKTRVESHIIPGAGHNDISENPLYQTLLSAFMK